jgi:hypothetical protein
MVSGGPVPGSHGGGPHADVPDGGGVELSREDVDDPVGGGDGQLAQHGQAHQQPAHVLQGGVRRSSDSSEMWLALRPLFFSLVLHLHLHYFPVRLPLPPPPSPPLHPTGVKGKA